MAGNTFSTSVTARPLQNASNRHTGEGRYPGNHW